MAYKKFDDAPASASDTYRTLFEANFNAAMRRAVQSVANRVLTGTGGTSGTGMESRPAIGDQAGVKLPFPLIMTINGYVGTAAAQDNILLPKGTQGSNTWVKYLIAAKFGTAATLVAGNEGASSTAAKLADLPDGYVGVGYMEYNTTSGKLLRWGAGTAGSCSKVSLFYPATNGTASFVSLLHMPMDQS